MCTESELKEIQNWDLKYAPDLIDRLREEWTHKDYFIEKWGVDTIHNKRPVLMLELHTGGCRSNEEIIKALQNHKVFWLMWWYKSERGGHYYFEIDYSQIGFQTVQEFTKENNITRQYVSKARDKFEWIKISYGKRLIRQHNKQTT